MSEFEDKLNAILGSPEAMAQVASLAQSLGLASSARDGQDASPPPPSAEQQGEGPENRGQSEGKASQGPRNTPDLSSLLGKIDPGLLSRFLPLLQEFGTAQQDERTQLLYALRPFLRESRRNKVDQALQIARILHLGRKFLGTLGES